MVFKPGTFHGDPPEIAPFENAQVSLEAEVAGVLATDGSIDASDVVVTIEGTRIVLGGTVGSRQEAQRAAEAALSVPGVTDVTNAIRVR